VLSSLQLGLLSESLGFFVQSPPNTPDLTGLGYRLGNALFFPSLYCTNNLRCMGVLGKCCEGL